MAHSKRNTSLAFFTAHERNELRSSWGSQSAHLTRDSFLPFGSCQLCLLPCETPVACSGAFTSSDTKTKTGRPQCHVFCRECAIANLLAQKQDMKREEKRHAAAAAEQQEAEARDDDEARARAVREFERVQAGLDVKLRSGKSSSSATVVGRENGKVLVEQTIDADVDDDDAAAPATQKGKRKRKFELDEAELLRIAREDRSKARKALDEERTRPTALPSFWLPSLTPSTTTSTPTTPVKRHPVCPASTPQTAHALSLKTLQPISFSTSSTSTASGAEAPHCPACTKPLTNATRPVLAVPCGHVLCGPCTARFVLRPAAEARDEAGKQEGDGALRCYVCEGTLGRADEKRKKGAAAGPGVGLGLGLVDIATEGTGFAAGGVNVVKKGGVTFEC